MAHTLQSALETGWEASIIQINFSATFDGVNHQGILFELCPVRVGCSVTSYQTQFLSNRSQYVVVGACRSRMVNVVSILPETSALGLHLLLLYTAKFYSAVENKLYGYADKSTVEPVVPSPGERVTVTESLNHDQSRVCMWCDLWIMKLNVGKTKTMIVSRSH